MTAIQLSPAASESAVLLCKNDRGIVTLTLNRPDQYNALSLALITELQAAVGALAADESARVVVIAGAGKAFCAGHDLKEIQAHANPEFEKDVFEHAQRLMIALTRLPQPVIARVHGAAYAAGCQLVAQCDLAVASTDAKFATSGVNYGVFCSTPGVPLARNLPRKRALEMLLTGEPIDAATALAHGLVNRVVPPARLEEEVQGLARSIIAKSPAVIAAGKKTFYEQIDGNLAQAYRLATAAMLDNLQTEDGKEGIAAFAEKRKPSWKNR
jgi:enoyl-CoA hydratase/carnithine racemase